MLIIGLAFLPFAAQLIAFYSIFYIALAALFAICMKGLLMTINNESPKWILNASLIGTNPGLGFRPLPDDVEQGSLIWYDVSNETQVFYWTNILDRFMQGWKLIRSFKFDKLNPIWFPLEYSLGSSNQKNCDFETLPNADQVCKLDLTKFDKCQTKEAYGYSHSSPCIFLKLNRIYGWVPEYYNDTKDLPEDMPQDLKDHIESLPESHRNQVWVSCRGENPADVETLGDPANYIEYFPSRGFPSYFYPYTNLKGYLSPLVAVKFKRPASKFTLWHSLNFE